MKRRTQRVILLARKQLNVYIATLTKGGNIVITFAILSLIISNSPWGEAFIHFWHTEVHLPFNDFHFTIEHFINDVLMSFFFLLVGLEIKSEILAGSLSEVKKASLPVAAALGGMIFPALIYTGFNHSNEFSSGWAIPMATDIAFALAVLNILKGRFNNNLLVLLTTLAVADDLGAIVVIALFYTAKINLWAIGGMMGVLAILMTLNYFKVRAIGWYLFIGLFLWIFTAMSGIHATIAGVMLAFTIPYSSDEHAPYHRLVDFLEEPNNYIILPVFAFCNSAVHILPEYFANILSPLGLGIILGLLVGKTVGIFSFSFLSTKIGISKLPDYVNWKQIFGVSILGGIGFTMSIFVTLLAFKNPEIIEEAKLFIMISSLSAAVIGLLYLRTVTKPSDIK